jgi:hypothetical protein
MRGDIGDCKINFISAEIRRGRFGIYKNEYLSIISFYYFPCTVKFQFKTRLLMLSFWSSIETP